MDCIITAGGFPQPEEPLYAYTQGGSKAVLDMGGRTMLERVVDALQDSKYVEEIVVAGLGDDMGMSFKRPVHHLPDHGSLINNAIAAVDWLSENRPAAADFIACSADVPMITGEMIDAFVEKQQPLDQGAYYILVSQEAMEARYPTSNRTFVKLKGVNVAGGDFMIMKFDIVHRNRKLWDMLANARKHAWKIAQGVGLKVLFKLLTRQLSIADIEETGLRLIGAPLKVVTDAPPEMAMDGDKPHQIDLLRAEIARLNG